VPVFFELCDAVDYMRRQELAQQVLGVRVAVNAEAKDFERYLNQQLDGGTSDDTQNDDQGNVSDWDRLAAKLSAR